MTDPRFDPAFQRGYDGPDPELVVREQVRAEPVTQVPVMPDVAAAPDRVDPASRPVASQAASPAAPPERELEPEQQPDARFAIHNPYRLALLLLGIALLIATVSSLYYEVVHPQASSTTADSQFVQLLISNLPPVLGLAGCVCVILWLALGALDHGALDTESVDTKTRDIESGD